MAKETDVEIKITADTKEAIKNLDKLKDKAKETRKEMDKVNSYPAEKLTLIGIGVCIGWISGFAIGILTGII